MSVDKPTERAAEALGAAQSLAETRGNQLVEPEHLLLALLDQPEARWLAPVRETAIAMMMDMIRTDLAALDIRHDVFFSERSLATGPVDAIAAW